MQSTQALGGHMRGHIFREKAIALLGTAGQKSAADSSDVEEEKEFMKPKRYTII
jgi:hypothetical protein